MSEQRYKGLRILGWIVGVIFIFLIILQLSISGIATKFANNMLENKGEIGQIKINLFTGYIGVYDLLIKQPKAFQNEDLLKLGELSVKINYLPLLGKKIVVNYLNIKDLVVDIQKENEAINLIKFSEDFSEPSRTDSTEINKSSNPGIYLKIVNLENISIKYTESGDTTATQKIVVEGIDLNIRKIRSSGLKSLVEKVVLSIRNTEVNIDEQVDENSFTESHIIVENFSTELNNIIADGELLQITNLVLGQDSLYFFNVANSDTTLLSMRKFGLQIDDLQTRGEEVSIKKVVTDSFEVITEMPDDITFHLYDLRLLVNDVDIRAEDPNPTDIRVTGKIMNQEYGDNLFGLYAVVSLYIDKFPVIDAVLNVIGLELEPMKALIPPGTYQALGGDAFDLSVTLSASETMLDCEMDIFMIQGSKLGMNIGGTPAKPELDSSSLLFNVFSRFGGGIGSGLSKVGGTTFDVAKTGLTAVYGVGKGATNVLGSVGKGVFTSVKGVVTLDAKELGEGLKTATVGSVAEAGKTVLDTGGNLLEGSGDALGSATGKTSAEKWRLTKQARWDSTWVKAIETVKK